VNRLISRFKPYLQDFSRLSYIHKDPAFPPPIHSEPLIDCALGTNPYGYSSSILDIFSQRDIFQLEKYPDPSYSQLVNRIIEYWSPYTNLEFNDIIISAGSSGLIERIGKVLISQSSQIFGYAPQFSEFITEMRAFGGHYSYLLLDKNDGFRFPTNLFINSMAPQYSIYYIDNPNNPTGQIIPIESIRDILDLALAFNAFVVVDEAYGDFADQSCSSIGLIADYPNLIVLRSFSKGAGLASLRVGYGVSRGVLNEYIRKVDLPFSVSQIASLAAVQSLNDEQFIIDCREKVKSGKMMLMNRFPKLLFSVTSMEVPITLIGHPDPKIDFCRLLAEYNILTESGCDFIGLDHRYVRLRVPKNMDGLIDRMNSIPEINLL